jgi:Flp pilus assembly protein TadD
MAQSDLKNYGKAENAFLDALKIDKTHGEAWFDLGLVYLQKTDFERAEKAFENAVKFKSVSASDAFNNLGVIFALRHEFDRAENHFETALKISEGKSATARNNLQFCKFYRQKNQIKDLTAKLEFSSESQNHLR